MFNPIINLCIRAVTVLASLSENLKDLCIRAANVTELTGQRACVLAIQVLILPYQRAATVTE